MKQLKHGRGGFINLILLESIHMKIGIDLDDTLGQSMKAFAAFSNDRYKTNLKIEDMKVYDLEKIINLSKEGTIKRLNEFHDTFYGKKIEPFDGAVETLKKLKKNNELYIVTSRGNDMRGITEKWVGKNFPNIFIGIYFTNEFVYSNAKMTKKTVCNNFGIDILIEDNLGYAAGCMAPNRKILLFDRPWNQTNKLPKGIVRVHSWKEIYKLVCEK